MWIIINNWRILCCTSINGRCNRFGYIGMTLSQVKFKIYSHSLSANDLAFQHAMWTHSVTNGVMFFENISGWLHLLGVLCQQTAIEYSTTIHIYVIRKDYVDCGHSPFNCSHLAIVSYADGHLLCNWPRVACDPFSNHVISISMVGLQLQGEISPFMRNISGLQVLNLTEFLIHLHNSHARSTIQHKTLPFKLPYTALLLHVLSQNLVFFDTPWALICWVCWDSMSFTC